MACPTVGVVLGVFLRCAHMAGVAQVTDYANSRQRDCDDPEWLADCDGQTFARQLDYDPPSREYVRPAPPVKLKRPRRKPTGDFVPHPTSVGVDAVKAKVRAETERLRGDPLSAIGPARRTEIMPFPRRWRVQ